VSELRLAAYAKVNLGLEVLGRRRDGFHELRTIFQTIGLKDEVSLRLLARRVVVSCDHPDVPTGASNLAARAAFALRRRAASARGVEIRIRKRIPVGGGLGGGSSDAAAVLIGLNHLWRTGLGASDLHSLARRLGADVPYFLVGGTALGLARGDEVYPLRRQVRGHVVVVDPGQGVSTALVFQRLARSLTPRENSNTIIRFVSRDLGGEDGFSALTNDLERVAVAGAPDLAKRLKRIRRVLAREGARLASLSGSGSSFFGLFDDAAPARRARTALAAKGFTAFCVPTLSLERYQKIWARSLGHNQPGRGSTR
jgi:4-diphosphocytidyl-2-C-methyl-D-erythritol kinase